MDPEVHRAMAEAIKAGGPQTLGLDLGDPRGDRTHIDIHVHVHLAVDPETRQFRKELLGAIRNLQKEIRMDKDEALAAIRANTDILGSIKAAEDSLLNGHATIEDELNDLKAQIAAGNTAPDFSDIEAAIADQKAAIQGVGSAIRVNTPVEQPGDANQPDSSATG